MSAMYGKSGADPKDPVQHELERLRARIAELEHALEVQEWGASIFSQSAIPQLILDLETGQIISANHSALQFYGYSLEELTRMTVAQLSTKENCWNPELKQMIVQARYGVVPARHRTASGAERELDAYFNLLTLRGQQFVHLWMIDITEQKRLQAQLEESEARYRNFIQMSSEGIWCFEFDQPLATKLDVDTLIQRMLYEAHLAEANDAFARMYGYESAEELVGARLTQFLIPDDPQNTEMLRRLVLENYQLRNVETAEVDREGNKHYFLNNMYGIVEDNYLIRVWGTQTDITEVRQLLEQLEHARRLETVGRLAGGIAHDFNNMLTAILGYAELGMSAATSPVVQRYFEGIQQACLRAADLTRQLLAYARRQVIQLKPFDARKWLLGSEEFLRRILPESVHLKVEASTDVPLILADETPMTQILLNLVINSRDAMPEGGTLQLNLLTQRHANPNAEPPIETDFVVLEVSDTGTGIAEENLPHIFEPFFTTKPVGLGTGMGLASVQGLVDQLGGFITVESREGQGTTFRLHFPVYREPDAPAEVS
ncbi:MAG: ATP-binding protein [Fimbriimonadales bacterium]